MKYIKHFEDNKNEYLIVDFFKSNTERFYIIKTTIYTINCISYDRYYYYPNDNIKDNITINISTSQLSYSDSLHNIKIICQSNSEEDAIEKLKLAIEINKYNL